jgi:hypothetical protein
MWCRAAIDLGKAEPESARAVERGVDVLCPCDGCGLENGDPVIDCRVTTS